MIFQSTALEGCFKITPNIFEDPRGSFTKIYNEEEYKNLGIDCTFKEQYYSISKAGVLRGMHFQLPPMDHGKLVTCLVGQVLDVVIDLRKNSTTFKSTASFILNDTNRCCIFVPRGFAHGFYVMGQQDALLLYNTETVYSPTLDSGILWSSIDFPWPLENKPIISKKDESLLPLNLFNSPF